MCPWAVGRDEQEDTADTPFCSPYYWYGSQNQQSKDPVVAPWSRSGSSCHPVCRGLALLSTFFTTVLDTDTVDVRGMDKLRFQTNAARDESFCGMLGMLKYKNRCYGGATVEAYRFSPSSRTCASCGFGHGELGSAEHESNQNAAANLANPAAYGIAPGQVNARASVSAGDSAGSEGAEVDVTASLGESSMDETGIRPLGLRLSTVDNLR